MRSLLIDWQERLASGQKPTPDSNKDAIRNLTLTKCIKELQQYTGHKKAKIPESLAIFNEIIDSLQQNDRERLEYKIRYLKSYIINMFE